MVTPRPTPDGSVVGSSAEPDTTRTLQPSGKAARARRQCRPVAGRQSPAVAVTGGIPIDPTCSCRQSYQRA
jgi:cell division septation protein DedD